MRIKNRNVKIVFVLAIISVIALLYYNYRPENIQSERLFMPYMAPIVSEDQFVFEMIPHHQEAVDTAKIILKNTDNEELKLLAKGIVESQTEEISMMKIWKTEWYSKSNYSSKYISMMPDLTRLSGEEQDKEFINGMIMHHQMAVQMAKQVLTLNPRSEVVEFANAIIQVQSKEIAQMKKMLESY